MSRLQRLLEAAETHDCNEERRYLRWKPQGLNVAWSWYALSWSVGISAGLEPSSQQKWDVSVQLGPFALELFWASYADVRGPVL